MCEDDREIESLDRAFRPSQASPPRPVASYSRLRSPQQQAEIDQRVAMYAAQVEQQGFITWLPMRGANED
jgi:hypothetical protein